MPRRAAADFGFPTSTSARLKPPDELPPGSPERKVFLGIVIACAPEHFRPAEIHLLVAFCRAVVREQTASGELNASGLIVDGKPNVWLSVLKDAVRDITVTSRLLRLTPLARHATPVKEAEPLSYYDRLAMEQRNGEPEPN